jgi:ABC-type oligopeptide transport system ATPase subunit
MSVLLEIADLHKHFPLTTARTWQRFLPWRGSLARSQTSQVMRAVDGVSLTVGTGECVGLVGESGSGKSTLVRVITRLLDPTAGSIRFQGRDIGSIPARRFARALERARLQLVFQDPTDSLTASRTSSPAGKRRA